MVLLPLPNAVQLSTVRSGVVIVSVEPLVEYVVFVPAVDVTFDEAVLGNAHICVGSVAKGAATNAERINFLSDRLVANFLFMD